MDFINGDLGVKQFANLPQGSRVSSMVEHNGKIFLCGGRTNEKQCLQWNHGTLKDHSTLNVERLWHSVVTTQTATFIFGGIYSRTTYEYLSEDSTKWLTGKTEILG